MPSPQMAARIEQLRAVAASAPVDLAARRELVDRLAAQSTADGVRVSRVLTGAVESELVRSDGVPSDDWVVYLHGGGYTAGGPGMCRALAGRLSAISGCSVLVPDYRLAPEHPFPAALHDVLSVYSWLVDQHPARVSIGGDSAGGGLASAVLLSLRDAGTRMPGSAFLVSPWTDLCFRGGSLVDPPLPDPLTSLSHLRQEARLYLAGADPADPLVSPVYADLRGLPPLHIEVGTAERLVDDARSLAAAARRAGVRVTLEEVEGAIHTFPLLAPDTPESVDALARIRDHITAEHEEEL